MPSSVPSDHLSSEPPDAAPLAPPDPEPEELDPLGQGAYGRSAVAPIIRTLPNDRPYANDAVLQVMRDSFDMLVIDLYSIREMLVMRGGLFALLKEHPERLHVRESSVDNPDLRKIVTGQIREAARWLLQTDEPATTDVVAALCSRFIADTKPLDRDRNQVRAHRFEHPGRDTSKLFIELPALQGRIDVDDVDGAP